VEVKIGVHNATRELVLESAQSPDEVEKAVLDALGGKSNWLELTDERGRRVIVVTAHLAYVEIGEPVERGQQPGRVGLMVEIAEALHGQLVTQ